jgi:serine protease AprX
MTRVSAFGMHESELNEATQRLGNSQRTESYVIGDIDETGIANLREAGLIVAPTAAEDPTRRAETPGTGAQPTAKSITRSTSFSTNRITPAADDIDLTKANVYLIRVKGPLLEDWKKRLEGAGVSLMESYGGDAYSAFLNQQQRSTVMGFDFVADVRVYGSDMTAPAAHVGVAPVGQAASGPSSSKAIVTYDIRLHPSADAGVVTKWLVQHNVPIAASSLRKVRLFS